MSLSNPIVIAFMVLWGVIGFRLAAKRDRNPAIGALVGFLGGLIGVGIYWIVTRKPKTPTAIPTELAPMP